MKLLLRGNSKLGKEIYHFPLPVLTTCKPSPWCAEHCYAQHGSYQRFEATISKCHEFNFQESKKETFVKYICDQIEKSNIKYVRIHTAGDFYSNEYILKWTQIACEYPQTKFLAFTKRSDLENIKLLGTLSNVCVRESLDPSQPVGLISNVYKAYIQGTPGENGYICSGKCSECFKCWYLNDNVILPVH